MKSLVVSVCITAVTDMAAVSLLVFWCSSGVLLAFFWCSSGVLLCYRTPEERQKNARRTPEEHQKNPEEPRRRRTPAPPSFWCSSSVLLVFDNTQKNARRTPEEPRRESACHQTWGGGVFFSHSSILPPAAMPAAFFWVEDRLRFGHLFSFFSSPIDLSLTSDPI